MTSEARRYLKAGAISALLLGVLLWVADLPAIDLSALRPAYLIPTLLAYSAVLVLRGAALRAMAPAPAHDLPLGRWITLAARHQLVFILAPSGSGDLAFPLLAGRMTGLSTGAATRLIAEARVRDMLVVLGLGAAGLVGAGLAPPFVLLGTALAAAALYRADLSVTLIAALLRKLRRAPPSPPATGPGIRTRVLPVLLPILLWLCASGGIMAGFRAAGHPLSLSEAWVMLAGLNIAGALALSVAGLGVAEAGAAGVLTLLGLPLAEAARIALIARPILLLSNAAASALIEGIGRIGGLSADA